MSLGPPFDDSGERLQLGLGAAAAVVLLFVATFAVLTAEHSIGESVRVHVLVARPGSLHTGAVVEVAGDSIGEVVAIRGQAAAIGRGDSAPVDLELRIQRAYSPRIFRNSTIVAVNPTLLTEALLEIGPPAHGAAPSEPISDGDQLRGVDPADIDQFMLKMYLSLEAVLRESRDLRPDWEEFVAAFSATSAQLSSQLPTDLMLRLALHGTQTRILLQQLFDKLGAANVDGAPAELRQISKTLQPLLAELLRLANQVELLKSRAVDIENSLAPRQRELLAAIAGLRSADVTRQEAERNAKALIDGYLAGRGTLGGFQRDIQLFDELKELSRILKRESWRILIKRPNPGQRNLR